MLFQPLTISGDCLGINISYKYISSTTVLSAFWMNYFEKNALLHRKYIHAFVSLLVYKSFKQTNHPVLQVRIYRS